MKEKRREKKTGNEGERRDGSTEEGKKMKNERRNERIRKK